MKVMVYALALVALVAVATLPMSIGWLLAEWRDNGWYLAVVTVVGYSLMIGGWLVYEENDLTGIAEVVGTEVVPAHNKSSVKTMPVIVGGKTSVITTPTSEYKAEEYTIHARQWREGGYKRYHLVVDEEEYNCIEIGQTIDLSDYKKVD